MVESSDGPSFFKRAYASYNIFGTGTQRPVLPLTNECARHDDGRTSSDPPTNPGSVDDQPKPPPSIKGKTVSEKSSPPLPPPAPPPIQNDNGAAVKAPKKHKLAIRFYKTCKDILLSSWLNVLLIFVPVGIAVEVAGVNPTIVFAINAVAIIPLAGLLSFATQSIASDLGDTIGALMNVTFGNAVELIIFIALIKNEIRIVQASLLGSILANLLLILGMCFVWGGLRFREQIYNNTVTQMSACLLSLSVMSLLLPTAFHASFTDNATADRAVLKVSRGTSVILLLVYVLYLLFQLKSHAYMYQSTPQHVIDEESHPGVLAEMLGSSISSGSSSSSGGSASDTDASSSSNTTAKCIKRVLRGRRRRKSSTSSKEAPSFRSIGRTPSGGTLIQAPENAEFCVAGLQNDHAAVPRVRGAITSGDEADTDGEHDRRSKTTINPAVNFRDFENEKAMSGSKSPESKAKKKRSRRKRRKSVNKTEKQSVGTSTPLPLAEPNIITAESPGPHVGFVSTVSAGPENPTKHPFTLRGMSVRGTIPVMPLPAIPKLLTTTFSSNTNTIGVLKGDPPGPAAACRSLRRTKSLTDLNETGLAPVAPTLPPFIPVTVPHPSLDTTSIGVNKRMSRTSAIILLIVSTGLVAVCAEFLVGSINYLVENTSVNEAFVGLIILPVVGNAAEHVTAVVVAGKNKMDLAIGVAVGSSIQIALFVTPVIVLLGWILGKDMSLFFSLFETVSLFVSAFIVNFLVLDGRTNYLEGALLVAAYVIIGLAAFFYPDSSQQSIIGGAQNVVKM